MDKEGKGPISWLKKNFSPNGTKKQGKTSYIIIVVLFGAGIMLAGNMLFQDNSNSDITTSGNTGVATEDAEETFGQKNTSGNNEISDYETEYKEQIKEAINTIAGVQDAVVYVNVDGTEKSIYEKDSTQTTQNTEETDTQGGKRQVEETSTEEKVVVVPSGDKQVPIVVETKKPTIRGVLIVASGAEDIKVKSMIIEAVTRALDVPNHRVSVMPKEK